ncbi:MAG: hypothetical protein NC093_11385 [Alistipes sp.]|nr:hypothetical protein [Alistipes sp.]
METHSQRIYVKVNSDFDTAGFMQPRTITWDDGRVFSIESVKDFRPFDNHIDRYTIVVSGKTKYLFFEKTDAHQHSRLGRWYVEVPNKS